MRDIIIEGYILNINNFIQNKGEDLSSLHDYIFFSCESIVRNDYQTTTSKLSESYRYLLLYSSQVYSPF